MRGARRWGDNDKNFGPFTFAWSDRYRPLALILKSWGDGDGDDGPSCLRLSLIWFTIIVVLPPLLRPQRKKVPTDWDAATVARLGRNWYWDVEVREYGFSYSDGFLLVHYGISPGDSSRDQTWGWHLPWTQWRHVRHSLYDLAGEHYWTQLDRPRRVNRDIGRTLFSQEWDLLQAARETCPARCFEFKDFDGETLRVKTMMEEREWRFGTGWWRWLSIFRRPKIQRTLDLAFSGEVGPEKGSWKGGTLGHSIILEPGELHEAGFRRYCEQEHRSKYRAFKITYIGPYERPKKEEKCQSSSKQDQNCSVSTSEPKIPR